MKLPTLESRCVYFWRTTAQLEIDFILYGQKGLIAIEVKRAKKIHQNDLKAMKAFQADYPKAKLYLFYGGNQHLYFDNIEAIPIAEALVTLPKLLGDTK